MQYLQSVRPLLTDDEYACVVQKSQDFLAGPASKIQALLAAKWLVSDSYVDDWWKKYAYESCRDTLIKTNVAATDFIYVQKKYTQAARAATLTILTQMYFRDANRKEEMQPVTLGGIPLCAQQYTDVFRTRRAPGRECGE